MKKSFRGRLSFSQAELRASVRLGEAGIAVDRPAFSLEDKKRLFSQFGWGSGDGDMNAYYPDVTGSNIAPKPEDFVEVPFRLITATTVGGGSWKATDFSKPGVLKASVRKLDKKPVYYDHETAALNWVGLVKTPVWREQFTNKDGIVVPAGIDALISIDAKTNPKLARGVLLNAIFSNSVTVEFAWEMSHSFDSEYEFSDKIGTMAPDGQMVRRVVTEVFDYHETSLLWLGADPFAKKIDEEGNLVNIDATSVQYAKVTPEEKENYEKKKKYSFSFAGDKNVLHLSRSNYSENKPKDMNKELIAALRKLLGLSDDAEITVEQVESLQVKPTTPVEAITDEQKEVINAFGKLKGIDCISPEGTEQFAGTAAAMKFDKDSHAVVSKALLNKLQEDAGKLVTLSAEVVNLREEAKLGKEYLSAQKAEAVRLYKLSMGASADTAVVTLMENAKPAEIKGLLKQYTKGVTTKFAGKCKSCGSDEFEFRSSVVGEAGGERTDSKPVTFNDIYQEVAQPKMNITKKG